MEHWLNSKVNDEQLDKFTTSEYSLRPYKSHYDKTCYYKKNDSDMKANSKYMQLDEENIYNDHIFLYPNTNRYHANYLFRKMIDISYDENFNYLFHDEDIQSNSLFNLMDVEFKESFYEFCYKNTSK